MKKVIFVLLLSFASLIFPVLCYADTAAKTSSIFGDMDDMDDNVVFIGNKPDPSNELIKYFSGLWESSSRNEKTAILFSGVNDYMYTNTIIANGYSNPPLTYYGKYVIRGDKEEGTIEVTFNNGDYLAFPYEIYGKDEYLIDKKIYKKSINR